MNHTHLKLETRVIQLLKSSRNIESIIKGLERVEYQVTWHPRAREEQMPIFLAFLYNLILESGTLPSKSLFINRYMDTYYKDIKHEKILYYAFVDRTSKAYDSLVRDLHFYFKLVESKKFNDVLLSYAFDIEAKQDIVITYQEKKLGLQLFDGGDKDIPLKKRQTSRRRLKLGYPDYFLPLFGSKTNPVNIHTKDYPFYVYSDKDVNLIYEELRSQSSALEELKEEKYIFPAAVKDVPNVRKEKSISQAKHSVIYLGKKNISDHLEKVKQFVQMGVRVEWISPHNRPTLPIKNLRVHVWKEASRYDFTFIDGIFSEEKQLFLKRVGEGTTFNYDQYVTEHASLEKHLIVEAGAGTGKTETLISRIIYLLHMGIIESLDEVVMITFTNEAADHMKSKLYKRLYELLENTGDIRYVDWSEHVASMRILTIPSFSKTLMQDFSSELGLSRNFSVRSLTMERREIIATALDEFINKKKLTYADLGDMREYELVNMIDQFWNQLEQKGIILENYQDIQWGGMPSKEMEKIYYELFNEVLAACEERFHEKKIRKDVMSVNDLTQKLSHIQPHLNLNQISSPFKFLFVDEFQDTDDIQIELVNTLAKITNAQLFVVGDIKQSIYRFRGANYTAFDLLERKLGEDRVNREFKLIKNYRTSSNILQPLEDVFDAWRTDVEEILPRGKRNEKVRLESTFHSSKYNKPYNVEEIKSTRSYIPSIDILNLHRTLIRDEDDKKDDKPVVLAVLVRTNNQANQMRDVLEELRSKDDSLVYEVVTGGSLFSSESARDLLILFNALCYDDDPESFYALQQTPFSVSSFNPAALLDFEGNRKIIMDHTPYEDVDGFLVAKEQLKLKPTLHVIYNFVSTNPFEEVLKGINVQSHDIQKYRLNLYRILELAGEGIEHSMLDMHHLRDWLAQQVATNRDEDEMQVDIANCEKLIKVMTVHKAKGLEFDTVFIPFTYQALVKKPNQSMIVVREDDKVKAAWRALVGTENKDEIASVNFVDLKKSEDTESKREEARLLYVALTRAKYRLVVKCDKPKYDHYNGKYNWADLMRLKMEGKR